jgi:putative endopeptidase
MTIRHLLLGASASFALTVAAGASFAASDDEVCLDEGCTMISLFGIAADGQNAASEGGSTEAPHYGTWGFDISGMDTSVKPGDSFFRYADGKAVDRMTIPSDRSRFGAFDTLTELSDNRLRALIDADVAQKGLAPTSNRAKIAALYKTYMDEARIERLDAKPLAPALAMIRAQKSRLAVAQAMGASRAGFDDGLFRIGVDLDAKNPAFNTLNLRQGGLGLPDRDYYLKERFQKERDAYLAYMTRMLTMIGWSDPADHAKAIMAFESKLAEAHWTSIERRDRDKTYNRTTVSELEAYAPGFPWRLYLGAAGVARTKHVIVGENTAVAKMAKIFAETPVDTLKAYEAFHTADRAAPLLSKRFVDASFDFHSKTLSGTPEQEPRWKRAISFTNRTVGDALGQEYVAKYFPPESKAKMIELVGDLRTAMKARLENLPWMSPATKQKALEKLAQFGVKIGYTAKWRNYAGLKVTPGDLYGDARRSAAFEWAYEVSHLDKPKDPTVWGMTPQTVNAYYSPNRNEIVFPAAILQPPFFDPHADMAVNYGGIGGVIGHEMGHGFDDQGRKSDGQGRLTDWWTAEDAAKFKVQADRLGKQYDAFEILPGVHVQGGLTMGENIGDLNGSTLALDAYHAYLHGRPSPVLDGFTGDQRVYLGWAQVWREKARDSAYKQLVTTNPHAPGPFRALGPLRNEDGWYAAFDVKPGDKYYLAPEDRVRMW